MKICIWGDELIAWVSGGVFAQYGNQVCFAQCFDNQIDKKDSAQQPSLPGFSEPGLKQLIEEQTKLGKITFCNNASNSTDIQDATIHLFCYSANQKSQALKTAEHLQNLCATGTILINQSNFGIGATEEIRAKLSQEGAANQHQIAYIPDNLPDGKAIEYLRNLSSLTIGCTHPDTVGTIKALMRPLLIDPQKVLVMSPQEAEFAKFAVTGMLALRIGYINELANLADQLGVDIEPIRHAMTLDSRISPEYLKPGCGFGGLNFPQYISGLADILHEERRSTLLQSVLDQNNRQKETPFRKLWRHYNGDITGKTISIWGLSFKPNTAIIDNAPSLAVIDALLSQGVKVRVHDPEAMENIAAIYGSHDHFELCDTAYAALDKSDGLILLTEWREYSSPDFERMHQLMNSLVIIDGRNLLDKTQANNAGFYYEGIGR